MDHLPLSKKTKIVATLGPASDTYEVIKELVLAGLNVARLNFSHGTHPEHLGRLQIVRQLSKELETPIAIMQDLQGPKIRLGTCDNESIVVQRGDTIGLELGLEQKNKNLPVQFDIFKTLSAGDEVLINDGLVKLKVENVTESSADCIVVAGGEIRSHKGINVPGKRIQNATLSQKDLQDLEFGIQHNVDYIALSFVQDGDDIKKVRTLLEKYEYQPKIISKIECLAAVQNLESIIKESDGVMVARGDMAIEVGQEEVPLIQRKIIELCKKYNTPVIVATQMLESMIHNIEPTRAEVNDIATAVLDQVDAVMLSAESAHGDYPIQAVQMMAKIIKRVEEYQKESDKQFVPLQIRDSIHKTPAITSAAALLSYELRAKVVFAITSTGNTAFKLATNRITTPMVAITNNEFTYRQLALVWGITSYFVPEIHSNEHAVEEALSYIKKVMKLENGDNVIVVASNQPSIAGTTNIIRVEVIGNN